MAPTAAPQSSAALASPAGQGQEEAGDPEFYKFLRENEKTLLNFDDSDEEKNHHVLPEK